MSLSLSSVRIYLFNRYRQRSFIYFTLEFQTRCNGDCSSGRTYISSERCIEERCATDRPVMLVLHRGFISNDFHHVKVHYLLSQAYSKADSAYFRADSNCSVIATTAITHWCSYWMRSRGCEVWIVRGCWSRGASASASVGGGSLVWIHMTTGRGFAVCSYGATEHSEKDANNDSSNDEPRIALTERAVRFCR